MLKSQRIMTRVVSKRVKEANRDLRNLWEMEGGGLGCDKEAQS